MKNLLSFILIFNISLSAQQFEIKGSVSDKNSGEMLRFSNILVLGEATGTTTNEEGNYRIYLQKGNHKLIFSFIGYVSDTLSINLTGNIIYEAKLKPISLELPEVTVLPGKNPALEIISRAIEYKKSRLNKLNSYVFKAYTKGLVKTTEDFSSDDNSVSVGIGVDDTTKLKITGIIENESKGYFKKPDLYKDEIIARKQTSNTPSSINVFTGGRLIQDFYSDKIEFFGREQVGPVSENALDYYFFLLKDTLQLDKQNVFKIYFEPYDKSDPGFVGDVYIADETFAMLKLDVGLNDAANIGGIFNEINIFQQFVPFEQDVYMPVDYRIRVEGNVLGLAKFGFELNSIFYNYDINYSINDDFFDYAIVTVRPDADTKDSTYWSNVQSIPSSLEETKAYNRIDSVESIEKSFWDRNSFLSPTLSFTKNFSTSGLLSLYHFNRVEGNALDLGFYFRDLFDKRFRSGLDLSYGFADEKFKADFSGQYRFGEYRTGYFNFDAFNKTEILFKESDNYNNLTSTITNLFGKYDFRDYYYTKGFSVNFGGYVLPFLSIGAGFVNRTDNSATVNTDFSFFYMDDKFEINPPIYETKTKAITAEFTLDFRKYIEDGYFRRKVTNRKPTFILRGRLLHSDKNFASDLTFSKYELTLSGFLPSYKSTQLDVLVKAIKTDGAIPYQMMYALPGNISGGSKNSSFRTLDIGEHFGDEIYQLNLSYNFRDELFRFLGVPYLEDSQIYVGVHYNTALAKISPKSSAIQPITSILFEKTPFQELGFSVGHPLFPLTFEFTWKLNYFGKNNFVISVNTFAL